VLGRTDVSAACDAGIGFVDRARSEAPLWSDFDTLAGASTEWVSAYVLYALKRRRPEPDASAIRALWRSQRRTGGWGYNTDVPPDCDSTAWALLALGPSYLRPSAMLRAQSYVMRHQDHVTGGFLTYTAQDGIHHYIEVNQSLMAGWMSPHTCVTAVALQALLLSGAARRHPSTVRRAVDYLTRAENDGAWESYWWSGSAYATYHALRGLALARALDIDLANRASAHLLTTQRPDGGWTEHADGPSEPFTTALSTQALMLVCPVRGWDAVLRAASWLTINQESDGGWPATPILQIPPPPEQDPAHHTRWRTDAPGTGVRLRDQSRVFTSAAVIRCLLTLESYVGRDC
jgi:squalene-hopene/tetraprenyl-beta-curcumene cyclase